MKGRIICFDYRERWVVGEIINDNLSTIDLKLHTDYKGKNVLWECGEVKMFEKSIIKNITVLK